MPVNREPTPISRPGAAAAPLRWRICSASGSSTTRNPSTLARIQPGLSTTATLPGVILPGSPVTSRTGPSTAVARSRSSATACRASARLTCGPGRAQRTPVDTARSQSIICPLFTLPPYVVARPGPPPAWPASCRGESGRMRAPRPGTAVMDGRHALPAPAGGEGGSGGVERGGRGTEVGGFRYPARVHVEGEQPAVAVVGEAGQGGHRGQVAGLRPDDAEGGPADGPEHAVALRQSPGEARDGQPGDDRAQARVIRRCRQDQQADEHAGRDPVLRGKAAAVHHLDAGSRPRYAEALHGRPDRRGGSREGGRPARGERHVPGQVLGYHVVAVEQHELHDGRERRRADAGEGGGPARRGHLRGRAADTDAVAAEESRERRGGGRRGM